MRTTPSVPRRMVPPREAIILAKPAGCAPNCELKGPPPRLLGASYVPQEAKRGPYTYRIGLL